jgi:hypothetical protein
MIISHLSQFLARAEMAVTFKVFSILSPIDLCFLSCTSSFNWYVVDTYRREIWSINRFLSPWFDSVPRFRASLAKNGAVVSGSQALRYFQREEPDVDSDLDVVVRIGGVLTLATSLVRDGYTQVSRSALRPKSSYPLCAEIFALASQSSFMHGGRRTGILDVIDFVKTETHIMPGPDVEVTLKVQLIVVAQDPVEHIIMSYHSSECILSLSNPASGVSSCQTDALALNPSAHANCRYPSRCDEFHHSQRGCLAVS